jgi:hypothetical protein
MKGHIHRLRLVMGQLDQRHIRLGLAVLTLVLFVVGAGAPSSSGG